MYCILIYKLHFFTIVTRISIVDFHRFHLHLFCYEKRLKRNVFRKEHGVIVP